MLRLAERRRLRSLACNETLVVRQSSVKLQVLDLEIRVNGDIGIVTATEHDSVGIAPLRGRPITPSVDQARSQANGGIRRQGGEVAVAALDAIALCDAEQTAFVHGLARVKAVQGVVVGLVDDRAHVTRRDPKTAQTRE